MNARERMAQALMASQAVVPPSDPAMPMVPPDAGNPGQNPYMPNPALEQAAQTQTGAPPLHPLVAAIASHLGLLNLVRNRANQAIVDPTVPLQ